MRSRPDPGAAPAGEAEWLEVALPVPPAAAEPAAALLERFGVGGSVTSVPFVEDEECRAARPAPGVAVRVSCYLPVAAWPARQGELQAALAALWPQWPETGPSPPALETRRWRSAEWERAWERFASVVRCGRLAIRPRGRRFRPRPGEVVVELAGGPAFGTGQHPTTRMALMALVRAIRPGQAVLDFGSGNGILACAAARLGALRVDAVDHDPAAVETARRNVTLNDLAAVVRVWQAEAPPPGPYDVVVANITAKTLAQQAGALAAATRPAGVCIFGGVIDTKLEQLLRALAGTPLAIEEIERDGEWRTVQATRPARLPG